MGGADIKKVRVYRTEGSFRQYSTGVNDVTAISRLAYGIEIRCGFERVTVIPWASVWEARFFAGPTAAEEEEN